MTVTFTGTSSDALLGMMIFSIGLPLLVIWYIRRHVQYARDEFRPWAERLKAASTAVLGAGLCMLFISPLVWTTFQDQAWLKLSVAFIFLGLLIIHASVEAVARVAPELDRPNLVSTTSLKTYLVQAALTRRAEVKRALAFLKYALLPNGFRDVHLTKLARLPFKSEYRAIGALY